MNEDVKIITYSSQNKDCAAPVLTYSPSDYLPFPTPSSPYHKTRPQGFKMIMKVMQCYPWTWHVALQGHFDIFAGVRQKE